MESRPAVSISIFILVSLLVAGSLCQQGITLLKDNYVKTYKPLEMITVYEGISTNVNILCTLDKEQPEPLYWKINENLYDLYNFPKIFISVTYGTLTLPFVNRRMDGWEIQCVRVTSTKELLHGEMTLLRVLHDADEPDTNTSSSLEPSHLGRIVINSQDTNIDVNGATISWLYYPEPDSPCAESNYSYYEVGLYSRTGSGDLQYLNSLDSMEESITITSNLISPNNETTIYFNVSVFSPSIGPEPCATTEYLQTFSGKENHTVIYADGNSSSFTIPSEFIDSPIQLIWSTDGVTQCVCPLVEELIPRCACNRNSTLSLSSNTITISRSEDVHSLVIYLANTSCCNVRSIIGIYRVIFDQGPAPEEPVVLYDKINRAVCFNETSDPMHSIRYQAIIKNNALLWTSEVVQGSQCIEVPMELYRNVLCTSFSLVFIAIDEFGEEIHNIRQDIDLQNVTIQVNSITSDSSGVKLDCFGSDDSILKLTLTQTDEQSVLPECITTSCNTTQYFNSLQSGTSYTLSVDRVFDEGSIICPLTTRQFTTKNPESLPLKDVLAIVFSALLIVVGVGLICGLGVGVGVAKKIVKIKKGREKILVNIVEDSSRSSPS